jgi:hypothetical protein
MRMLQHWAVHVMFDMLSVNAEGVPEFYGQSSKLTDMHIVEVHLLQHLLGKQGSQLACMIRTHTMF